MVGRVKIMLATPAYGGNVTANYMQSVVYAMQALPEHIELVVNVFSGDSLITRARNTMVAQFLASDCDALLWVDADIGFDPEHIVRLVGAGKDVVAGVYPIKEYHWDNIVQAAQANPLATGYEHVAGAGMQYVTNGFGKPNDHGYAPVYEVGTGFMLIQRRVFETLASFYPDRHYVTDRRQGEQEEVWNFFDAFTITLSGKDDAGNDIKINRYLSEDYAFCALWREAGGEIWVDVASNVLTHQGTHTWGRP